GQPAKPGSGPAASASAPTVPATSSPAAPAAAALVGDIAEHDVRVETREVIAVFTNRGARLKSWRLKKYRDQEGKPQELVENQHVGQPLPFTLSTTDPQHDATLNSALYSVNMAPAEVISSPFDLRFEYRDASGVQSV